MTLPFSLPDWLPWWVPLAVLVPALLYLLIFLLMPFSVFGLKRRLDAIEARLDEIHGEIRSLVLRVPELRGGWTDQPPIAPVPRAEPARPARPPIPPAPVQPPRRPAEPGTRAPPPAFDTEEAPAESEDDPAAPRRRPVLRPARPGRNEPRLDWPR